MASVQKPARVAVPSYPACAGEAWEAVMWMSLNEADALCRRWLDTLSGFCEAVSDSGFSKDHARLGLIGLDLLAELPDVDAQILSVGFMSRAPYGAQNLLMCDHLPGMARKECEKIKLFRRELHVRRFSRHRAARNVDL